MAEIEIKVQVSSLQPLLLLLEREGVLEGAERQIDEYFSPAHRDFLTSSPIREWLRLRTENDRYSLNYKYWHYDEQGKSHHCDEYETHVEDIQQLKSILLALNFKSLVTVEKLRKSWRIGSYQISVDNVSGLGDFVEVEYRGPETGAVPGKITEEMLAFLKKAGCGKLFRNFQGYPFLLLFPERAVSEEV